VPLASATDLSHVPWQVSQAVRQPLNGETSGAAVAVPPARDRDPTFFERERERVMTAIERFTDRSAAANSGKQRPISIIRSAVTCGLFVGSCSIFLVRGIQALRPSLRW